jgi:cell division protein FtsB
MKAIKRKLKILIGSTVLLGAIFYVGFLSQNSLFYLMRLQGLESDLKAEIVQIQKQNDLLLKEIAMIKKDDYFLEKVARDDLGLVRPGEVVIIFQ